MEKYLTKDEVKVILQNAPKGTDGGKIVDGLVARGFKLEGYNDQPEPPKSMTGSDSAIFQANGNEGLIGGTAKAIGNTPQSAVGLVSNIGDALIHPVRTVESIGKIASGVGAKIGETFLENTDIGQSLMQKANENRVAKGLPELKKDANGKFQAEDTPDLQAINQVGKFFTDRYGSINKFKETAIEDPVGVLADVAAVLSGGAGIASKIGEVSKIAAISNAGAKLGEVSRAIEPINAISKTVGGVASAVGNSTPGRIVSDIIPSVSDVQKSQITKALDLTQGDLATIGKKTGNDVTEFIISNNLLKESPEAIADSLNSLRKDTMQVVRDEVAKVPTLYSTEQAATTVKGLNKILEGIDGVAGLEDVTAKVRNLLAKNEFTLSDIQTAKELIDENSNIYSKIGDVKSSAASRGLDNIRKDIKTFIEKEVSKNTNGAIDIAKLNNNVSTSYAIEDAINTRATRDLTRQKLSLGDSVVLFGGGAAINPAVGIGLYLGKKVIESPSFRIAFTKALSSQPIKNIKMIVTQVKNSTVSPSTQKLLNDIAKEAMKNAAMIESTANVINKSKEEK